MADLFLIVVLILFSLWGYKRGFIRTIVGFMSTLISLIVTTFLYSPIASFIYNIGIGDLIKTALIDAMENGAEPTSTSMIIVNIISFLLIIIVIKILLSVLVNSLNLIAKLPIIKQANALLGLCTGFLSGLLISYIAIGIIGALSGNDFVFSMQQHIRTSYIAELMYEGNIVTKILSKIM